MFDNLNLVPIDDITITVLVGATEVQDVIPEFVGDTFTVTEIGRPDFFPTMLNPNG